MRKGSCQCLCGNIKIKGNQLPPGSYPNLPATERANIVNCHTFFAISKQSVTIQNLTQITSRIINPFCTEISCKQCSTAFRFFSGRSIVYCGVVGATIPKPNQRHQTLVVHHTINKNTEPTQSIPNQLRPLLANDPRSRTTNPLEPDQLSPSYNLDFSLEGNDNSRQVTFDNQTIEDNLISNEDIDFSLMFSSNADPIVGSYKAHITLPQDSAIPQANQDWGPKSYFV